MSSPAKRLKLARLKAGKSPEEIARIAGVDIHDYYDMESAPDELSTNVSLKHIKTVCDALSIKPSTLFSDTILPSEGSLGFNGIPDRVRSKLNATGMKVAELEERVGYSIESALDNPTLIWDWNIDCLQSVCDELGLDWVKVLP